MRAHGEVNETKTPDQLEQALRSSQSAPQIAEARIARWIEKDVGDLLPAAEKEAAERLGRAEKLLARRGEEEALSLQKLLENQRARIMKASSEADRDDPNQFALPGVLEEEKRERAADRRHWTNRLARLEREIAEEPVRVRSAYEIRAHRLEPVGVVYLWPVSG